MKLKNITLFRLAGDADLATVPDLADSHEFRPTAPTETRSTGLVPPRGEAGGPLIEAIGGEWIAQLAIETRTVPAVAIKRRLDERADQVERETGRRPRGKRLRELKDDVLLELLPHAFPRRVDTSIWISPRQRLVVIGSTSGAVVDAAISALVALGLQLDHLTTALNPATAMAAWLVDEAAPAGFTLDRQCELKQPDGEKAVVRYARHTLELAEIGEHIRQGKVPTLLALTWNGRVSFLLTDSLTLRGVQLLDVDELDGTAEDRAPAFDAFDGDVALVTGELSRLVADLVEALGGELLSA